MKIEVNPKVRKVLIIILVISLLLIALLAFRPVLSRDSEPTPTNLSPDARSVVEAVASFYTLDSTESSQTWATRVCAYTTKDGCEIIRSFYAPNIQTLLDQYPIDTGCTVVPVQLVEDGSSVRIWQVQVTLDHPWGELESPTQTVYVEMAQENDAWLMNRILFEQESDRFESPSVQERVSP